MRISLIAAMAENGVIGRGGQLPWRLKADLARFKQLTLGHTLIMGRKTWESIGRPLAGRRMIVVTRQSGYSAQGAEVTNSLEAALEGARSAGEEEAFVIGGAEIYRQALPLADRLYMTLVLAEVEGDTKFPEIDWDLWARIDSKSHDADAENEYPMFFYTFERCAIEWPSH
ncbi:MAG: dihydrofolate reductase [Pirellulales bacterium]